MQKIDQQEFRIEKVIKKNGDKLYVKWKGYDNSLNSWIDKKDKLKTVPVDLSKLSNVVKNDVVKQTEYNKLVTKVDNIDATNFVKKKQI